MKKKKKHNWMSGFVITKPMSDIDNVSMDRSRRISGEKHKIIKNGR